MTSLNKIVMNSSLMNPLNATLKNENDQSLFPKQQLVIPEEEVSEHILEGSSNQNEPKNNKVPTPDRPLLTTTQNQKKVENSKAKNQQVMLNKKQIAFATRILISTAFYFFQNICKKMKIMKKNKLYKSNFA